MSAAAGAAVGFGIAWLLKPATAPAHGIAPAGLLTQDLGDSDAPYVSEGQRAVLDRNRLQAVLRAAYQTVPAASGLVILREMPYYWPAHTNWQQENPQRIVLANTVPTQGFSLYGGQRNQPYLHSTSVAAVIGRREIPIGNLDNVIIDIMPGGEEAAQALAQHWLAQDTALQNVQAQHLSPVPTRISSNSKFGQRVSSGKVTGSR